jgi:hypothetical protein
MERSANDDLQAMTMMTSGQKSGISLRQKLSYAGRWLPGYFWQRLWRKRPPNRVHLVLALADHFEPAIVEATIVAKDGAGRAPWAEQERRLERWCREYPKVFGEYRDADGRPFVHTYFYPAEQYDRSHVARLAEHCHAGWGEIEIHLHHGVGTPDTAENTRRQLVEFRDQLADEHGCLSYAGGSGQPRYAFVHGNFALANSNRGRGCGVDSEMQILAETGCYADMTLPTAPFHWAQTGKVNAIYECGLPLGERAPHRRGKNLARGRAEQSFPIRFPVIVQGPLMLDFQAPGRRWGIDNSALTGPNPASLRRLENWKRAAISVEGQPHWVFIKLHCHGMDPRHDVAMLGAPMQQFLRKMIDGAGARGETLHFVSAREMVNIMLAARDGREGNPGDYRDYLLKRERPSAANAGRDRSSEAVLKG